MYAFVFHIPSCISSSSIPVSEGRPVARTIVIGLQHTNTDGYDVHIAVIVKIAGAHASDFPAEVSGVDDVGVGGLEGAAAVVGLPSQGALAGAVMGHKHIHITYI